MNATYQPGTQPPLAPVPPAPKRKRTGLLIGVILGLIVLCCLVVLVILVVFRNQIPVVANLFASPTPTITLTPTPTSTPTPTPTPTPLPFADVLTSNGFARDAVDDQYCETPCRQYWNETAVAGVRDYDDGSFAIWFLVRADVSNNPNIALVVNVVSTLYGPEFGQWVQAQSSLPVSTTISGRAVVLKIVGQDPVISYWLSIGAPGSGN